MESKQEERNQHINLGTRAVGMLLTMESIHLCSFMLTLQFLEIIRLRNFNIVILVCIHIHYGCIFQLFGINTALEFSNLEE